MRITEPKRPGEDAGKNAEQFYKWMYQVTEQLNMVMEQLERNNVLDLQAGYGTASEDGLLSGSVAGNTTQIESVQAQQTAQAQSITDLEKAVGVLETHLGGYTIKCGTASIEFGTAAKTATVYFNQRFSQKPAVMICPVFDDANITLHTTNVYPTGFIAGVNGTFSTSGTREFMWIAVGK